jgi:hypothetical protein
MFNHRLSAKLTPSWITAFIMICCVCVLFSGCNKSPNESAPPADSSTGNPSNQTANPAPATDPAQPSTQPTTQPPATPAATGPKPAFPLYAISAVGKYKFTPSDLAVIANSFQMIQTGTLTDADIDELHKLNPNFKAVRYLNGSSTTQPEHVNIAEHHRMALAMYWTAGINDDLDSHTTEFKLRPLEGADTVALKASTAKGDYSSTKGTKQYVTWIRIGDELMRIESFDAASNTIRVTRGFDGTTAASHPSGDRVFSPVYLGSVNDVGAYPDGPGNSLQYVFDAAQPFSAQFVADAAAGFMTKAKYDGVWLDTYEADFFNIADVNGNAVDDAWDFKRQEPYTPDNYREALEIKLTAIQNDLNQRFGKFPALYANNMKSKVYYPGHGEVKKLLEPTNIKPRPLDGFSVESFAGSFAAKAAKRDENGPKYIGPNAWRDNVKMVMDAAQAGAAALPMIANAGVKSELLEKAGPIRDKFELFAYASYLMAVEANGKTMLGLPAFYQEGGKRYAKLSPIYTLAIGKPLESRKPDDVDGYRPQGHASYMRTFANGIALVNPTAKKDTGIELTQPYIDPSTGDKVTTIDMDGQTGKILLLKQP